MHAVTNALNEETLNSILMQLSSEPEQAHWASICNLLPTYRDSLYTVFQILAPGYAGLVRPNLVKPEFPQGIIYIPENSFRMRFRGRVPAFYSAALKYPAFLA